MKKKIALNLNACLIIAVAVTLVASAVMLASRLTEDCGITVPDEDQTLEDLEEAL